MAEVDKVCDKLREIHANQWKSDGRSHLFTAIDGLNFELKDDWKEETYWIELGLDSSMAASHIIHYLKLNIIDLSTGVCVNSYSERYENGADAKRRYNPIANLYLFVEKSIEDHKREKEESRKQEIVSAGKIRLEKILGGR